MDCGTYYYRAPEITKRNYPYDGEKADVFSLAIIFFAVAMRKYPTIQGPKVSIIDTPEYKHFSSNNS